MKYDSATGKFEWVGASLFTPISQQIISHSASGEGLYAGGGKLEYRNVTSPVFIVIGQMVTGISLGTWESALPLH